MSKRVRKIIVPGGQARAFEMKKGQLLTIVDIKGYQVADFIAFNSNDYSEKLSPYECGFEPFEDARLKFDVRYYLIAILFILFDLEIAFLFPWAAVFQELIAAGEVAWFVLGTVLVFLTVLVVGYIVEWKNGALDWE